MDQTTKGKNKAMKVMIIILVILGLSAGAVAYYLSSIEEFTPTDTEAYTLDTSDMCQYILYATNTTPAEEGQEETTTPAFLSPGDEQSEDITIATGQSLYTLIQDLPSDAPEGYSFKEYSLTVNGVTLSPEVIKPEDLEPETRTDLLSALAARGEELTDLSGYIILTIDLDGYTDQIDLDQPTLNTVATATIATPEGDRKASCAGIFAVNTTLQAGADPSVADDTPEEEETPTTEESGGDPTDDTPTIEDENTADPQQAGETSDIAVSKTGTTCVERIAPDNEASFTITITNNDTDNEEIVTVKDKMPLGFTYTAGTTRINGAAQSDDIVTVITTGDTQEITWDPATNWSLAASESLIIQFEAVAGEAALSGSRSNEVVVTPLNTPVDAEALRTEFVFTVASNCENPDTGLFDTIVGRVAVGLITIMMAVLFYKSENSIVVSENLAQSQMYKAGSRQARLFGLKLTSPREYFEEKFKDKD